MKYCILLLMAVLVTACQFSEYAQAERLVESIDDHRIGCEIADPAALLLDYKQWEANRWYDYGYYDDETPEPTPVPEPVYDSDIVLMVMLEYVWEHGCDTGRRDAVGAEQAAILELRDQLNAIEQQLSAMETPTPTP